MAASLIQAGRALANLKTQIQAVDNWASDKHLYEMLRQVEGLLTVEESLDTTIFNDRQSRGFKELDKTIHQHCETLEQAVINIQAKKRKCRVFKLMTSNAQQDIDKHLYKLAYLRQELCSYADLIVAEHMKVQAINTVIEKTRRDAQRYIRQVSAETESKVTLMWRSPLYEQKFETAIEPWSNRLINSKKPELFTTIDDSAKKHFDANSRLKDFPSEHVLNLKNEMEQVLNQEVKMRLRKEETMIIREIREEARQNTGWFW